jgi:phosphatidate cytidylyltransferase
VLGLIALDLWMPVHGQAGVWMIPLYYTFALATAWEASQLLSKKWPLTSVHLLVHCAFACTVCLFPMWYSLVLKQTYPLDCAVGRAGWLFLGVLTGVGTSGIHALVQLGTAKTQSIDDRFERTCMAWFLSVFLITYIVGCMSIWFLVRMHGSSLQGMLHLIAMFAIVKFADTGAYFAGKSFGRRKLIPQVSPGKTIEGLLGGLLLSVAMSYLFLRVIVPACGGSTGTTLWGPALLGVLLTIVGLVGDLLESMVKRTVGAKDSGRLLPGLGGVWDVTDSLLPTAIVGYLGIVAKLT